MVVVAERLEPEQEIYTSDIKVLFRINDKLSPEVHSLTPWTPEELLLVQQIHPGIPDLLFHLFHLHDHHFTLHEPAVQQL